MRFKGALGGSSCAQVSLVEFPLCKCRFMSLPPPVFLLTLFDDRCCSQWGCPLKCRFRFRGLLFPPALKSPRATRAYQGFYAGLRPLDKVCLFPVRCEPGMALAPCFCHPLFPQPDWFATSTHSSLCFFSLIEWILPRLESRRFSRFVLAFLFVFLDVIASRPQNSATTCLQPFRYPSFLFPPCFRHPTLCSFFAVSVPNCLAHFPFLVLAFL